MKKLLLGLLIITPGIVIFAGLTEKPLKVELLQSRWQQHLNGQQYIANSISNSDLPARQVRFIIDSIITPLQADIINQVRPQLDTIKKK